METFLKIVQRLIISFTPVIMAGILNMFWVKVGPDRLRIPLDHGLTLADGRRLFGQNKTYLGLVGYVMFHSLAAFAWGIMNAIWPFLEDNNYFYQMHENNAFYNILIGALMGLAYTLFELPNSFMKRRVGIEEGKSAKGIASLLFTFLDQVDSLVGVGLVLCIFYPLGIKRFLILIFIGFFMHALINFILYLLGLRKNPL